VQLVVNVGKNSLCINGTWTVGSRRWEAAVVATLIAAEQGGLAGVSSLHMNTVLAEKGQRAELNRTQWRRIWESVRDMFSTAKAEKQFDARFGCAPRQLTVGPWRWSSEEADQVEILDERKSPTGTSSAVRRFASDGSLGTSLVLLKKLAVAHALWVDGSRSAAIDAFRTGTEWKDASPELLTHQALQLADLLFMTSRYAEAHQHLMTAELLLGEHACCRDQTGFAILLRTVGDSLEMGVESSPQLIQQLRGCGLRAESLASEFDYRSRSWACLCLGRALALEVHKLPPNGELAKQRKRECLDTHFTAIFNSILGGMWDLVVFGLESLLSNLTISSLRTADHDEVIEIMNCQQCAQHWKQLFDPTSSMSIGDTWLAALWLCNPWLSDIISRRVKDKEWLGERPDRIEYYRAMSSRREAVGDPAFTARAALMTYRFAKQSGHATDRCKAQATFQGVCKTHPMILRRIKASGMMDDAPELIRDEMSSP